MKVQRTIITVARMSLSAIFLIFFADFPQAGQSTSVVLNLKKGAIADYGATPWYTEDISVGISPMQFALDTGTNLLWATSTECNTTACNAHNKVDTKQSEFSWVAQPDPPKTVSFGPWGSMGVWTGKAPFNIAAPSLSSDITFYASVNYGGEKFQYLAWGAGIGFPSESSSVTGTDFFFQKLVEDKVVDAEFSVYTDGDSNKGEFILGQSDTSKYDPSTGVNLPVRKSPLPDLAYLWGTTLDVFDVGGESIINLENAIFFLDTGSSRFKGDDKYVYPIMNELLVFKDSQGNGIFVKYFEKDESGDLQWVGLEYATGGPSDYPNLPDISLTLGDTCNLSDGEKLRISLSPDQYSYQGEVGERQGKWIVAVHRLDGVGGLLVGSTFMDLIYTSFQYQTSGANDLSQGNMTIFKTRQGEQPSEYQCIKSMKGA